MSICTNESTTKIAKLSSRELKICTNLGQIRENICTRKYWRIQYMGPTVKPCLEAHMDMILSEVFLNNIHMIPQDHTVQ